MLRPSLLLPEAYKDAPISLILATFVLAILLPVCIALWLSLSTKSRQKSKTVLLLGPSGAGKTALYTKLLFGAARPTQTSLVENQSAISYEWTEAPDPSAEPEDVVRITCLHREETHTYSFGGAVARGCYSARAFHVDRHTGPSPAARPSCGQALSSLNARSAPD